MSEAKIVEDVEIYDTEPQENNKVVEGDVTPSDDVTEGENQGESLQEIEISDDDIQEDLKERKDRVQKRIDKLTAEKYGALEEVEKLRQELESIKSKVDKPEQPKYTNEQLNEAIALGMEEGNSKLVVEAIQALVKNEREAAIIEISKPKQEEEQAQARKNQIWSNFISSVDNKDKDFDLNDQSSPAFKYTLYYLQNYKDHYAKFGDYAEVQAANDALRAVSELKHRKRSNTKIRTTEKELAKEKMKTLLDWRG